MPASIVKKLAKEKGISNEEAEKRWDKAKKITEDQTGMSESDGDKYWAYVVGVFKKSMGVKEAFGQFVFESPSHIDAIQSANSWDELRGAFMTALGMDPAGESVTIVNVPMQDGAEFEEKTVTTWTSAGRLERLKKEAERLQKKAGKFKIDDFISVEATGAKRTAYWAERMIDVNIKTGEQFFERFVVIDKTDIRSGERLVGSFTQYEVTISGKPFTINGWTVAGKAEHVMDDKGNFHAFVTGRNIRKADVPSAEPVCVHCGVKRTRKNTYILRNEQGEIKQVGSTCMDDFTGHKDADALASLVGSFYEFFKFGDGIDDYDEEQRSGKIAGFDINYFLPHVVKTMEEDGEYLPMTAMFPTGKLAAQSYLMDQDNVKPEHKEKAKKVIEWAKSIENPDSSYLDNIKTIAEIGFFSDRMLGIAASMVQSYNRDQARKGVGDGKPSEYIGSVGDKVWSEAKITFKTGIDGQWGTTYLYTFKTHNGDVLKWFSSGDKGGSPGDKVEVTGTVKKHEEYNGIKQTVLTRCKLKIKDSILESTDIDEEANKAATSPENDRPEPTEAQKQSGNYKVGHIKIAGLDITIENPAGSERSGIDPDGNEWSITLKHHYGYIKGSVGKDKDHVDVFINPDINSDEIEKMPVFIVDQINDDESFDEHKCIMGYEYKDDAIEAYLSNYEEGWAGLGAISELPMNAFKAWVMDKKQTKKAMVLESADEWIGVDLDGTLAEYTEWKGPEHIGKPVKKMMDKVKAMISDGKTIKIFTARASKPENIKYVKGWLEKHGLGNLEVTNEKDDGMVKLYDDRAVPVEKNTGEIKQVLESAYRCSHEYGCLLVELPETESIVIRNFAYSLPEEDFLLHPETGERWVEENTHITIKYGILPTDVQAVSDIVSGKEKIKGIYGTLGVFYQEEHDVLFIRVSSDDIVSINETITRDLPCCDSNYEYTPHATIAFLKKGSGEKYDGMTFFSGIGFEFDRVEYSDELSNNFPIFLKGFYDA